MMNDPREEEDKLFDPTQFSYFEYNVDRHLTYNIIATVIDPAGGERPGEIKKGRRDFAAIVTGGRTHDGYIDILDVSMTKKPPNEQISLFLDHYDRWRPRIMGAEENMFKNLLGPDIDEASRKRKLYPNVRMLISTSNKVARITGTEPLLANGTVRFARHLIEKVPTYFGQWDEFPGEHEDGPDATEMLIRLLESKSGTGGVPTGIPKVA
jgi:predicted phage terminase large subunit-like protein